jgi:hypothetical protein
MSKAALDFVLQLSAYDGLLLIEPVWRQGHMLERADH